MFFKKVQENIIFGKTRLKLTHSQKNRSKPWFFGVFRRFSWFFGLSTPFYSMDMLVNHNGNILLIRRSNQDLSRKTIGNKIGISWCFYRCSKTGHRAKNVRPDSSSNIFKILSFPPPFFLVSDFFFLLYFQDRETKFFAKKYILKNWRNVLKCMDFLSNRFEFYDTNI